MNGQSASQQQDTFAFFTKPNDRFVRKPFQHGDGNNRMTIRDQLSGSHMGTNGNFVGGQDA